MERLTCVEDKLISYSWLKKRTQRFASTFLPLRVLTRVLDCNADLRKKVNKRESKHAHIHTSHAHWERRNIAAVLLSSFSSTIKRTRQRTCKTTPVFTTQKKFFFSFLSWLASTICQNAIRGLVYVHLEVRPASFYVFSLPAFFSSRNMVTNVFSYNPFLFYPVSCSHLYTLIGRNTPWYGVMRVSVKKKSRERYSAAKGALTLDL